MRSPSYERAMRWGISRPADSALLFTCLYFALACSQQSGGGQQSGGAESKGGGATASGGTTSRGGGSSTQGGGVASGGAPGAGGAIGQGGSGQSGGAQSSGGSGGMASDGGSSSPTRGGAANGGGSSMQSGGAASGGGNTAKGGGAGTSGGSDGGSGGTGGSAASDCTPKGRAHNPLVTQIFTADPNAIVYGDRVYVYTSHDVDGQTGFDMVDYHAFSSDDLVNWQDHGVIIQASELPWATNLYAPGACAKNGKYYLYIPNSGSGIGVAVADKPGGPFVDPLKKALITKSFPNANVPWLFDPACFVDDDGQAYLYFGGGDDGGQNARVVRLNDDMISIKDSSATKIPTTAFFEASFMHKR
ncbi:MAG TPA: family 43 glycosylhydrolase, partial [Polyangiaceae bacterium]|nr:family 43 glycosylhydrolase [Polyangiaceae bacterium]